MSNIKIGIKIHQKMSKKEQWKVNGNNAVQSVNLANPSNFTFDHLFGSEARNCTLYLTIVEPIVKMCLSGYNGTIFVYGETSSGKSQTMMGTEEDPGIQLMAIGQIFKRENFSPDLKIRVGYIEIYNELVYDLLNERNEVQVESNGLSGVGLTNGEISVESMQKTIGILFNCSKRQTSSLNESHTIFQITIESEDKINGTLLTSYLKFVYVSGSKRVCESAPKNADLSNKSLLWLNRVVHQMSEGDKDVNFQNSTLTQILQDSLAGNSNTAIIGCIRADSVEETISTLEFVNQAKNVQTTPVCNQNYTDETFRKICEDISSMECNFLTNGQTNTSERVQSNVQLSSSEMKRKRRVDLVSEFDKRCKRVKKNSELSPTTAFAQVKERVSNSSADTERLVLEYQLQEIVNLKVDNLRLIKELDEVKSAQESDRKWSNEQIMAAKLDQQKSEFRQVQDKIKFDQERNDLELRNQELWKENENLKIELKQNGEGRVVNPDNKLLMMQLLSKFAALHKIHQTDTDLVQKQKNELMRLSEENAQLKQKIAGELVAEHDIVPLPPPSPAVTADVETGVQQKIERLEEATAIGSKKIDSTTGSSGAASHILTVPNRFVGCIMGLKGCTLKYIKQSTGANIVISSFATTDRSVAVYGTSESVNLAINLIRKQIRDFESKQNYNTVQHNAIK